MGTFSKIPPLSDSIPIENETPISTYMILNPVMAPSDILPCAHNFLPVCTHEHQGPVYMFRAAPGPGAKSTIQLIVRSKQRKI